MFMLAILLSLMMPLAHAQLSGLLQGPARPAESAKPAESAEPADAASYATLADLLEDDAARNQLIGQLRMLAGQASGGTPSADATGEPAAGAPAGMAAPEAAPASGAAPPPAAGTPADTVDRATPDFSDRVAEEAKLFVEDLADGANTAVATLRAMLSGDAESVTRLAGWPTAFLHLLIVLAATLVAFIILRAIASRLFARMDAWVLQHEARAHAAAHATREAREAETHHALPADQQGPPRPPPASMRLQFALMYGKSAAILGGLVVDVAAILLAGGVGYAVALFATGSRGVIGPFEQMFINAFLAVEISRSLVRLIFATRYQNLRLLPVDDDLARYWNRWLERVAFIAGYGVLLVVPLIAAMFSPAVGQMFGLIIMLGVYIYAVRVIWKNRLRIRDRLKNRAKSASTAFFGTLLRMLARTWHLVAMAYFTVLLVASQVDPSGALPYMTYGTLQSVFAIGIGLLLSAVLTALLSRRITLSDDVRRRLPLLENRLNSYIPAALKGIRLFIMVAVTLFVLDAWRVFSLSAWVTSEQGATAIATVVRVAIVLSFAALAWTVVASVIEHRLNAGGEGHEASPRERTLLALFRNATLILIVTMTVLIVLSQIGINIGPLVAGAGVVGLAIGFGAQKLVQDVINGVFIQLENGMNENDVVEAGGVFGTVEKITIRSVGIRTLDGGYHMIPFSSVDKVTNHMRDFSFHLGEYTISYRESVEDAAFHLERAFEELMTDPVLGPEVMEDMTIAGVTSLNERGFTIRVLIKTKPGMQWAVQRGYNRLVKKHFGAAGIELPYPHTVVYFGQDKNGFAPPASVHHAERRESTHGRSLPAGYTPRSLQPASNDERSADVLGNEMATVVGEDGEVTTQPGTTAGRDAQQAREDEERGKT